MQAAQKALVVRAFWDEEAKVWVATSEDVPGLVTEAANQPDLINKLKVMIPELLDENGYNDGDEIPFRVLTEWDVVTHRRAAIA